MFFFMSHDGISQEINSKYSTKKIVSKFRYKPIDSKKHLLSLSASHNLYPVGVAPSLLMEGEYITKTTSRLGLIDALYINHQFTLNQKLHLETGFKYVKHYHGYQGNLYHFINGGRFGEMMSIYSTFFFDFGGAYRVITNNNFRLFDLHAGISIGIADKKAGTTGSFSTTRTYTDWDGNSGILNFSSSYVITNRMNFGWYVGVSKDIRITENLYLTGRFHNYFGKSRSFSHHTINYSLSTIGVQSETYGNITSKGRMYSLGLKWLFN